MDNPWLVHRLTYRRTNRNLHVRGYKEEGTITTAFDMRVQNELDRFHLVQDVVDRLPPVGAPRGLPEANGAGQAHRANKQYIDKHVRTFWKSGTGKWTAPRRQGTNE